MDRVTRVQPVVAIIERRARTAPLAPGNYFDGWHSATVHPVKQIGGELREVLASDHPDAWHIVVERTGARRS